MKRWRLVLVALALMIGNVATVLPAQAATIPPGPCPPGPTYYARCFWHGYYSNKLYDYGGAATATRAMVGGGLPTSMIRGQSDFIYYVTKWLNGDDIPASGDPNDVNTVARMETTASFYINTMLGYQATSFDATGQVGGVYNARKHLADWTALIRRLDAAGEIQWNNITNVPSGTGHSFWTGDSTVNGGVGGFLDAAFYETQALLGEPLITFTYPNGTVYSIRRICGNVMSNGVSDAQIDYELTPTIGFKSTTGTIGSGNTIKAGDTLTFDAGMQNNSNGDPADTEIGAPNPNPTYVIPKGQTVVSDGLLEEQYYGDPNKSGYLPWPATPAPANPSYVWARSSSPPKADTDWNPRYTFSYQISPNTPDGTPVCFNTYVDPAKGVAGRTPTTALANSNKLCYTVTNPAFPLIVGEQGDVHAGGGVSGSTCNSGSGLTGSIIGNAGSYGEYVVSANGSINSNFSSVANRSPGNQASLGSYYAICRPDLWGAATAYRASGQPFTTLGSSIDLSTLNDPSGVYYVNGNTTISGTLSKKATIIVSGTVTINGNILLGGSAVANQQPSLGIIANGDIRVTGTGKGVNQTVDAFLFANGGIDTCFQYVSANYAACQNILTVNGFLMGKVLAFHRLGTPLTTGGTVNAETIHLLPQLYLNPPKLFDDAANRNLLQNEGERLPLN